MVLIILNVIISLLLVFYRKPTLSVWVPVIGCLSFLTESVIYLIQAVIVGQNSIIFGILIFLSFIFFILSIILLIISVIKRNYKITLYELLLNLGGCTLVTGIIIIALLTVFSSKQNSWQIFIWPEACILIGQFIILLNKK